MLVDAASVAATVALGLSAGLFFAFTVAVMPGLRQVDDSAFVATMTAINRAILNPAFGIVFVGTLVLPALAAVLAFTSGESTRAWFLVAAGAVNLGGVLAVTGAVNVPLNEALARDGSRAAFETRWVRFNAVRTVSGTLALVIAVVGLLN
jgi:uncharacterized membrane protein